jgi:hypothetical protein
VRTFRPALAAPAVLLLLLFCADSHAGRFCRQRCGNNCCAIPCWVRWFDIKIGGCGIELGVETHCFCCQKGSNRPMNCDAGTSQCEPGTIIQVIGCTPPPNMCGSGPPGREYAFQGCTTGWVRLYAMVYDPCSHLLRFALPCENWTVLAPLWMIGLPPAPPYSK